METWKPAIGFSSYEVSSIGRVRRVVTKKRYIAGMILSPKQRSKGHMEYRLVADDGKQKDILAHRLVALTFLGSCPSRGYIVCHNNGKPDDNRVENLRWATNSDNQLDRRKHGTSTDGHRHPFAKLSVEQVKLVIEMWSSGMSQSAIARHFEVVPHTICRIVNGKSYTAATKGEELCQA